MLDTYTLSYLGPPLALNSSFISGDNALVAPHHGTENLEALAYRLPGAYGFFGLNKSEEEQYNCDDETMREANPPGKMREQSGGSPPYAMHSGIVCVPTGFHLTLPDDNDEEEEEEEEDYSTEDEDFLEDDDMSRWNDQPEPPNQLLAFANSVTTDIQRYFTRNKDNDDFCDIFEDKFKQIKSGQELYYRDLMAVAQFGSDGSDSKGKSQKQTRHHHQHNESCSTHTVLTAQGRLTTCTLPHTGKLKSDVGLGPFQELFDSVLRDSLIKDEIHHPVPGHSRDLSLMMRYSHIPLSLMNRKLPNSFWDEPGAHYRDLTHIPSNQTLDFSDLLAGWANDGVAYA